MRFQPSDVTLRLNPHLSEQSKHEAQTVQLGWNRWPKRGGQTSQFTPSRSQAGETLLVTSEEHLYHRQNMFLALGYTRAVVLNLCAATIPQVRRDNL